MRPRFPLAVCSRLGILLLLALATPRFAHALGESYDGMPVASFKVEGAPGALASELKKGLRLSEKPGILGLFGSVIFTPEILHEDRQRARLFLARNGYPSARIQVHLEPNRNGDQLRIGFLVQPGPAVLVQRVECVGFPPEIPESALRGAQKLATGAIFTDDRAAKVKIQLRQEVRKAGYADATVDLDVEILSPSEVALRYSATPGPRYVLGRMHVQGPSPDLIPVVERVVKVPTGEPYSPTEIEDIEWRLRQLNLFRRIELTATANDDQVLDLNYQLTERLHRRWEFGAGWFTDERLRVSASWEDRNLFKAGRGLRLSGVVSSIIANFIASTWWPAVWATPYTIVLSLDSKLENEQGYDQEEVKISSSLVYRPRTGSVLSLGYSLSYIDLRDNTLEPSADQDPEGLLNRVFFSIQLDKRNDFIEPTAGQAYYWGIEATPPDLGSVDHFAKTQLGASTVHRLRGPLFAAFKGMVGMGTPLEDSSDIIISERFFAGGARSHRGYQRNMLGPRDRDGNPLGGQVVWESSAELRFPLWKRLGAALFVDVAQLWRTWDDVFTGKVEWAMGPSISVRTPVGPIRLDYGFRVPTLDDGLPNQVLHLQVGYPF